MPPTKKPAPPRSLPADALEEHRARLTALRDRLTAEIGTAPVAYVAGLARQLQAVLTALNELPRPAGTNRVDQLARQRAARLEAEGIPLPPSRRTGGGG